MSMRTHARINGHDFTAAEIEAAYKELQTPEPEPFGPGDIVAELSYGHQYVVISGTSLNADLEQKPSNGYNLPLRDKVELDQVRVLDLQWGETNVYRRDKLVLVKKSSFQPVAVDSSTPTQKK